MYSSKSEAEILDAAAVLYRLVAAEDFPVAVPCDYEVSNSKGSCFCVIKPIQESVLDVDSRQLI